MGAYFFEGCWHFVRQKHEVVSTADGSSNTCRRVVLILRSQRGGRGDYGTSGFVMLVQGLCNHISSLSSGSLLGYPRSNTREWLQGWRREQGSHSFLFAFCSYCCHPPWPSACRHQLTSISGTEPVREHPLRGQSPQIYVSPLLGLNSISNSHSAPSSQSLISSSSGPLLWP